MAESCHSIRRFRIARKSSKCNFCVTQEEFRKEGKLREKIRIEGNKAIIQYTSSEGADRALQTFKNGKIGKY